MIPVYKYRYNDESDESFINGKEYTARVSKKGSKYIKDENGEWVLLSQNKLTVSRLYFDFDLVDRSYANSHKEAMNFNWGK